MIQLFINGELRSEIPFSTAISEEEPLPYLLPADNSIYLGCRKESVGAFVDHTDAEVDELAFWIQYLPNEKIRWFTGSISKLLDTAVFIILLCLFCFFDSPWVCQVASMFILSYNTKARKSMMIALCLCRNFDELVAIASCSQCSHLLSVKVPSFILGFSFDSIFMFSFAIFSTTSG